MPVGAGRRICHPDRLAERRVRRQADGRARGVPELRHLHRPRRSCVRLSVSVSDTTWSAYNRWPSQWSLYDDGRKEWYIGPKTRVSWDRPYGKYCQVVDNPLVTGSGSFMLWEFPLAYWMEKQGYDVSYIRNVDTHADVPACTRAKGFLSVGHDEYWSREMYDNVKAAIGAGVSVGFLSSDTCWGLIPFWPSGDRGTPHRVISAGRTVRPARTRAVKKYPGAGPVPTVWADGSRLIGARNVYPWSGGADWICSAEKHWLFAGTGMKNGDRIPGLVGWEWMSRSREHPRPGGCGPGPRFSGRRRGRIHGHALSRPERQRGFQRRDDLVGRWDSSAPPGYMTPSAHGVDPRGPDPRVQRITSNLFRPNARCVSPCAARARFISFPSSAWERTSPKLQLRPRQTGSLFSPNRGENRKPLGRSGGSQAQVVGRVKMEAKAPTGAREFARPFEFITTGRCAQGSVPLPLLRPAAYADLKTFGGDPVQPELVHTVNRTVQCSNASVSCTMPRPLDGLRLGEFDFLGQLLAGEKQIRAKAESCLTTNFA